MDLIQDGLTLSEAVSCLAIVVREFTPYTPQQANMSKFHF